MIFKVEGGAEGGGPLETSSPGQLVLCQGQRQRGLVGTQQGLWLQGRAAGQELWLLVKESTHYRQTEARQGGSRGARTPSFPLQPPVSCPEASQAQRMHPPEGPEKERESLKAGPQGRTENSQHTLSENTFLPKRKETVAVLLASEEAVRIGQEVQAPEKGTG